jgi:hypothetical protein
MIDGVRIQLQDITKVPQYLSKNKSIILQWGASFLVQHLLDTQCPAAANERITHEDFSISFRITSLSDEGRRLNPMGRNKRPMLKKVVKKVTQKLLMIIMNNFELQNYLSFR